MGRPLRLCNNERFRSEMHTSVCGKEVRIVSDRHVRHSRQRLLTKLLTRHLQRRSMASPQTQTETTTHQRAWTLCDSTGYLLLIQCTQSQRCVIGRWFRGHPTTTGKHERHLLIGCRIHFRGRCRARFQITLHCRGLSLFQKRVHRACPSEKVSFWCPHPVVEFENRRLFNI